MYDNSYKLEIERLCNIMATEIGVNIVVYGGELQAVAAACKAAANAPDARVAIVIPDTSGLIGGIATAAGQNYWDTSPKACQGGTFAELYQKYPRGYNVDALSSGLLCLKHMVRVC